MKKSIKKAQKFNIVNILVGLLTVGISAWIAIVYLDGLFEEYGLLLSVAFKLLVFIAAYYVQLIVHEFGHLIAGLLSGYSFGSFRVGSIMVVKDDGKIKIKRQNIFGTGGQCLMTPPPMVDGKYPFVLYNLGGVLMNFITLPLCVLWLQNAIGKPLQHAFSVLIFLSGLIIVLTNGIPLKLGMINNDGSNAIELRKNKEARIAFHNQFMVLDMLRRGTRLKDMPDEYFSMPSDKGMKNSIAASAAMVYENRLIDAKEYDNARALIDKLLAMDSALIGIHRNLLLCDKITLGLLNGRSGDDFKAVYEDKNFQTFIKQMKGNISIIRTQIAYTGIYLRDEEKLRELFASFEKAAGVHPYEVEIETERELLEEIKNLM